MMKKVYWITFVFLYLMHIPDGFTQFAEVGSSWHYSYNHDMGYTRIECIRESASSDNEGMHKILHSYFKNAAADIELEEEIVLLQEAGKVYFNFENKFYLIYDFGVSKEEIVTFYAKAYDIINRKYKILPLKYKVTDISEVVVDNVVLKKITTALVEDGSYLDEYFYPSLYVYTEKLGSNQGLIFEVYGPRPAISNSQLRCYSDEEINFISEHWEREEQPCDYIHPQYRSAVQNIDNNELELVRTQNGGFIIRNRSDRVFSLDLINMNGCIIKTLQTDNNGILIDTSSLMPGVYVLLIKSEGRYYYKKLLI